MTSSETEVGGTDDQENLMEMEWELEQGTGMKSLKNSPYTAFRR